MATRPLTEAEVLPVFEPIVLEQTDALAGRRLRAVASWARGAFLLDAVMLLAAALAADLGSRDAGIVRTSPVWLVAYGAIVLFAFYLRGLYAWRVRLQVLDDVRTVVTMTALASMVLLTLRILLPGEVDDLASQSLRLWAFSAVYLAAGRVALDWAQLKARRDGEPPGPRTALHQTQACDEQHHAAGRRGAHPKHMKPKFKSPAIKRPKDDQVHNPKTVRTMDSI